MRLADSRIYGWLLVAAVIHHFWPWIELLMSDIPWDIKIFVARQALGL